MPDMPPTRSALPWLPLVFAAVLILVVSLRTINPYPARPAPAPEEVQVVAGSTGAESDGTGAAWWFVVSPAELRVSNNVPEPRRLRVTGTVENGPCDHGRTVEVAGDTLPLPPGAVAPFDITIPMEAYGVELVPIVISGAPCEPVGNDPRRLLVRLRDLVVRAEAG